MSPRRSSGCGSEDHCPEPGRSGAPVSFAGVLLASGAAYMAYIGDMRVYRFRDGRMEERARDDAVLDGGASAHEHGEPEQVTCLLARVGDI
ncbi:hypothetical protein WME91_37405 [Sorangium sp. So ce269]